MLLSQIRTSLLADVTAPRHQVRWVEAQARRPALAAFSDVASLIAGTSADSPESDASRDQIVRALIAEHQASSDSFWAAVLIVQFYPLLRRVAIDAFSDTWPVEDREQLVLESFLRAIRHYALRGRDRRVCFALRMRTRRLVFHRLTQVYRCPEIPVEPHALSHLQEKQALRSPMDQMEEAALTVARLAASPDATEALRLHIVRDPLRRRIREQHPDADPVERERLYQREKRRRSRAAERVRAHVRQILGSPLVRTRSKRGTP